MSLYLGKITPHVRRDELERVFQRFGRCSLQVKDKYGFVVYDYPVNAERALRTLQGKKICGELLTLSWSNNQPSYRVWNSHGRNCRDESYVNRKLPSYSRREEQIDDLQNKNELNKGSEFDCYEPCSGSNKRVDGDEINFVHQGSYSTAEDFQQRKGVVQASKQNLDQTRNACYNCGKLGHQVKNCPEEWGYKRKLDRLKHIHSDKRNYNSKDQDGLRRMGSDTRGRELPGKDAVTIRSHKDTRVASSNDRREEQIDDLQNENELNKRSEFDRYEPCSGSNKRVDGDGINFVHQDSYSTAEDFQQRKGVVQASKQNLDQTRQACYNCGKLEHKMQNCPEEWGYKRKLGRFKHIHSDERNYNSKDQDGLRRMGSDPRGRELPAKDAVTVRSHKDTREASSNRNYRLYTKADYSTSDNRIQASLGKQYEKVKRIRESQSPEHRAKKSRRPQSSPILSDDKVSRSRSSSIYSKSSTRSKSVSRSRSGSRVSLYATTSSGCRSSTPPSLQNGEKDSFKANSPEQNDVQVSSAQLVENGNAVVNSQVDNGMDTNHIEKSEEDAQLEKGKYPKEQNDTQVSSGQLVENGNAVVSSQVDNGMDTNHIEKSEEDVQLDKGEYPKEQNDTQVSSAQLVENGNAVVNSQVDNGMDTNHIEKSEEDVQLDKGKYPKEQNDTQVSSAQLVENGNAVVNSQVDNGMDTNHLEKSEEDVQLDKGKYPKEQNDTQVSSAQLVENGNAVVNSQVDNGMDTNHIEKSEEDVQLDKGKYPKEQNDTQVSSAQLVENGNAVVHSQVDKGMDTNHTQKSEEDSQLDEGNYPKEQNDIQVGSAQLVENANAVIHSQVDNGMDTNHIQKSEEDTQLDEGKHLSKPLLENDALNDVILSPTSQRETKDLQSCDLDVSELNTPSHKTTRSMCLTSEEILMVLRHYGLKQPVEVDKGLLAESFFGCARLWPWEVIYYRRLKKGPISVENYARRIFQNKEFGIVDKYVRSSSGWGEEES